MNLPARLFSGLFEEIVYDVAYDILYDYPSNDACAVCHHELHGKAHEGHGPSYQGSSYSDHLMVPCLHCSRTLSSHRYSSHLEKCLGLGGRRAKKDTLNVSKKHDAGSTSTATIGSAPHQGHARLSSSSSASSMTATTAATAMATVSASSASRLTAATSTAALSSGSGDMLDPATSLTTANPFDFMTDSSGLSSFDPSESDSDLFSSQPHTQARGTKKKSAKKK